MSVGGIPVLCCATIVIMENTAQRVSARDGPIARRTLKSNWALLIDALMLSRVACAAGGRYDLPDQSWHPQAVDRPQTPRLRPRPWRVGALHARVPTASGRPLRGQDLVDSVEAD